MSMFVQIDPQAVVEHKIDDVTFSLRPLTERQKMVARATALSIINDRDLNRSDSEVWVELLTFEYVRLGLVRWDGGEVEYKEALGSKNIERINRETLYVLGIRVFELCGMTEDAKKKP